MSRYQRMQAFLLASLPIYLGCGGSTQIPTSYTTYNSRAGTFQCEVPENWEAKGGGKRGPEWAKISSGVAIISVKTSLVGSLINDIGGGNSIDGANFPQFEPVHAIHIKLKEAAEQEYEQYTELPGGPIVLSCPLGPARCDEFTAKNPMGVPMHGYRASIMGRDKMLIVFCVCRESDWQALKPFYDRALATMNQGIEN